LYGKGAPNTGALPIAKEFVGEPGDELSWGLWDRLEVLMSGLFYHINLLLKTRVFVRKKPGR
jgi:hypothetical protein